MAKLEDYDGIAVEVVQYALANIGIHHIVNYLDDSYIPYDDEDLDELYYAVRAFAGDTEQRIDDMDR